jgi:hypothetical protein
MFLKRFPENAALILAVLAGSLAAAAADFNDTLPMMGGARSEFKTNGFIAEANLSGNLQMLTDADGGVYALKVVLRNLSKTNDLDFKLIDVLEHNFWFHLLTTIEGRQLEKPRRKLKDYEMHYVEMRVGKSSKVEWFIRISDYLESPQTVPEKTTGALLVSFPFRYRIAGKDAPDGVYTDGSMKFMVFPVVITRKALEGDPTEKYENSLKASSQPKAIVAEVVSPTPSTQAPSGDSAPASAKVQKTREEVMNDLRQIHGAKYQWALEHGKKAGDVPTEDELKRYLKENRMPTHPSGGNYIIHAVGEPPESTLYGKLPH